MFTATVICDKCHAGQMVAYEKRVGDPSRPSVIMGSKCDRCGYVQLDNDDDVWSAVGL